MATPRKDPKLKELVVRARKHHRIAVDADSDNRQLALVDLKFANEPGAQWDANMKRLRGDRPCPEFNKCRINGKKVINEIRANRPQGKVRATEGGDQEIAEIYSGLCRNIWASSDGDTVVDQAAEYQVDAGMAAWRIETKHSSDSAFDQDIIISGFKNPFCVYVDPACQDPLKRDARFWVVTEKIPETEYEERWPEGDRSSYDDIDAVGDELDWHSEADETIRVCEYWYKEPHDKTLWLLQDGTVVDSESDEAAGIDPALIKRTRTVRTHKIMMCIIGGGDTLLEGPVKWAGSQFPFVMIYGETKIIEGKFLWWGLHRFAKDAQQSYNISRAAIDETIAMAPQAKFWATQTQAAGHIGMWSEAHQKGYPFLLYNPDAMTSGPPQRMGGADVPAALLQQAIVSAQDIRDVTGLHEASFGEESGEKSGVALARKQNQAQIVTYNFPDNIAKGIRRTWEIMIDLIPHIYDAERELRILGEDGAEDYKRVNQIVIGANGEPVRVNDLSVGKYDVTVTVGPGFATQRQEMVEVLTELAGRSPEVMSVTGDLLFKASDLPYASEIAERMRAMLPPPIQQLLSSGKEIPPEAQAALAQADQAMQAVQQQTQLVQQAAAEVEQEAAGAEAKKAEVEKAIAALKVQQAQFEANVTKRMAELAIKEAGLQQREQQIGAQQEQVERGGKDVSSAMQSVERIDELVAAMIEKLSQAGQKQRPKELQVVREPGQPVRLVPVYEDA